MKLLWMLFIVGVAPILAFGSEYTCNFLHGWPPNSRTSVSKLFHTDDEPIEIEISGVTFTVKSELLGSDQTIQLRIANGKSVAGTVVKDGYDHPYLAAFGAQVQCWLK